MKHVPMSLQPRTANDAVQVLNEALALDAPAVARLISCRVPCNLALAAHPTIVVGADHSGGPDMVGLIGVLNGIFGDPEEAQGPIAVVMDPDDAGIHRPLRFILTGEPSGRTGQPPPGWFIRLAAAARGAEKWAHRHAEQADPAPDSSCPGGHLRATLAELS